MKITENKTVKALLENDTAIKIIVAVGIILIVVIFLSDFFPSAGEKSVTAIANADEYVNALELRLEEIISEIDGVGKIKVMITLDNLDESVYSSRETAVLTTITPVVRGAAVVCEGGDNIFIKEKIVETVSKVLGISTSRVCVTY